MAINVQRGGRMADLRFQLYPEGFRQLEEALNNLGKNFPKAKLRQAANKGANLPLRKARANAPKKTGQLKKGIVKVEEKKWKANKKLKKAVFQIYFDGAKNDIFRKPLDPDTQGSRGGQTRIPFAYYPVSLEYGFHTGVGVRTEPKHFIKNAVEATQEKTIKTVVDTLIDSVEKIARG
jgi:hypothetical protein